MEGSGFAPSTAYYSALVDGTDNTFSITPTAMDADYKSLTVNGNAVVSGEAFSTSFDAGKNRFTLVVTVSNGATQTYTLDVTKVAR